MCGNMWKITRGDCNYMQRPGPGFGTCVSALRTGAEDGHGSVQGIDCMFCKRVGDRSGCMVLVGPGANAGSTMYAYFAMSGCNKIYDIYTIHQFSKCTIGLGLCLFWDSSLVALLAIDGEWLYRVSACTYEAYVMPLPWPCHVRQAKFTYWSSVDRQAGREGAWRGEYWRPKEASMLQATHKKWSIGMAFNVENRVSHAWYRVGSTFASTVAGILEMSRSQKWRNLVL
jgi:hypothetical protein